MRSYTLKPIFEVSHILVFLHVKLLHSHFIQWIYYHIVQIDKREESARSVFSLKSLLPNDAHTETMGRRSD